MRLLLLALACLAGLLASPPSRAQSVLSDPCMSATATQVPFALTTVSQTLKVVSGVTNKRIYVCYVFGMASVTDTIIIVEGTGVNCGTGQAAVVGSPTVGLPFGSNGGFSPQRGNYTVFSTQTAGDDLCFTQSTAGPFSGWLLEVTQ